MAIMAELHAEKYFAPKPDSEYLKKLEQEYWQEMKDWEEEFWEVDCQAWPIDFHEKELLVKAKCARAAQILRANMARESR